MSLKRLGFFAKSLSNRFAVLRNTRSAVGPLSILKRKVHDKEYKHDKDYDYANDPNPNYDSIWGVYTYRKVHVPESRAWQISAWSIGVVFWYWVLWHVYYQFNHITGHFVWPEREKWTDEELGIPPDTDDIDYIPPQMDIAHKQL